MSDYELIDSGFEEKLERFGKYILRRPSLQAIWLPQDKALWEKADATFTRKWSWDEGLAEKWEVNLRGLKFLCRQTDFGHVGLFPEHANLWEITKATKEEKALNLFAYTGALSIRLAQLGYKVCHVDASKKSVAWAKENAQLNHLKEDSIRWIIEDAISFMKREVRRGNRYEVIALDPPTFGRGTKQEVFKLEEKLHELLTLCKELLAPNFCTLLFTTHTPGYTPQVLHNLLYQYFSDCKIEVGELFLTGKGLPLPSGSFAKVLP